VAKFGLIGKDILGSKFGYDSKLVVEKENLSWLKEQCEESERLTSGMIDILCSFEKRLGKLEETILPVYQETGNLQRRQENIEKTLEELDHVINYYNVSKDVEAVIREGPTGATLHAFLQAMARLKDALEYFSSNNPGSLELENVRSLHVAGGNALSREFSELLKKHSRSVSAIEIINSISANDSMSGDEVSRASSDDFISITHFPEEVLNSLILISEWLCNNDKDEYMNVYASIRGNLMKKSLEQLRDHQRSCSGGSHGRQSSPNQTRKFASPAAATALTPEVNTTPSSRLSSQSKRLQSAFNKRMSSMSTKLEAKTGYTIPGRRSLAPAGMEESAGDLEVDLFLTTVSGLQRLMCWEQQLLVGIIPVQFKKKIFELICRESLDLALKEGEAITARVRKSISNYDFEGVMMLFHVLRHMNALKPQFDKTLEGCDHGVKSKYNSLYYSLQTAGTMALDGFIEGIRTDGTTREKMPKDGTVFQLTANIMRYLENLIDYIETIAEVLGQDAAYNQSIIKLPRRVIPSDRPLALLGLYVKKVLVQLNLTLVNKSDTYTDPFLKAIFRLNNNVHILRSICGSGLLDVVSLSAPECRSNYEQMITEQKRVYSQSWETVLQHIWSSDSDIPTPILMAPGKLQDKYCKIIKDKFNGFNYEIETITATQKRYSIPDMELRESLKRDNKEYILPKYNAFYDKYVNVVFTKNTDKYIKYTPAQVSALIDSFFDVAA